MAEKVKGMSLRHYVLRNMDENTSGVQSGLSKPSEKWGQQCKTSKCQYYICYIKQLFYKKTDQAILRHLFCRIERKR